MFDQNTTQKHKYVWQKSNIFMVITQKIL